MKNTRQIAKESTRLLILEKTKELIISNGILNTSTKQISNHCKVAHGTLFSHFNNREELFGSVIKHELIRIAKRIKALEDTNPTFEILVNNYLLLVAEEESFLCVINKEFPFLSDLLQREIITTESIVKKLFYHKIEQNISSGEFKDVNITAVLSFFFGTIQYYLVRKELISDSGSVIKSKQSELTDILLTLLKKEYYGSNNL